ncbi:hypothetical protein HZB03_05850, partial [Candidatus Woesearchaeota archaeon]|nr:hypothetical protein [Candidatus Woesearchaeota archaeon]
MEHLAVIHLASLGSVENLNWPAPQGSTRSLNKSIALIISRAGTPAARPLRVVTTAGGLH